MIKNYKVKKLVLYIVRNFRKKTGTYTGNFIRRFIFLFALFYILIQFVMPGLSKACAEGEDPDLNGKNALHRIRVSGDHAYPPYEYLEDGLPVGFNIELLLAVAEVMGMQAEVELRPWEDARASLKDGRTDVLAGMYYSEERARDFSFSVPHTMISSGLFIRKGSPIKGLKDLQGRKVLVQDGDIMHDYLLSNPTGAQIVTVRDPVEALRLISEGKGDAALLSSKVQGMYFVNRFEYKNIIALETGLSPRKYCFAVAKGNEELLNRLNEGLAILKSNNRYQQIHNKWFGVYEAPDYWRQTWRYLLPTIVIMLALVLTGFIWSWTLKQTVIQRTKELTVSRQNMNTLFRESPAVIIIVSRDDNLILEVNDAFQNISGILREEAIGRTPEELNLFQEPVIRPEFHNIENYGNIVQNIEIRLKNKDGNLLVCLMSTALIEFENKPGFLCHISDITDRKMIEEALRESEELQSATLHSIGDGVIACNNEGRIKSLNRMAEIMTGWNSSDASGKNIEEVFKIVNVLTRENVENPVRQAIDNGKIVAVANHTVLITRDGRELQIADSCAPIHNSEGKIIGAVLVFRDVTEEYRWREELIRKNKELLDFAYTVSHDLKNPIYILTEFLTAIKNDPSMFDEYFERTLKQTDKMLSFIDNLLKLSKAGQLTGEICKFQLESLFRKVYESNKSAELSSVLIIHSSGTEFKGDIIKFEQLFANLITNSIRYRDPSKDNITIEFDCKTEDDGVSMTIKDNGRGIESREINKVFNVGYTSDKKYGSGFGLTIVSKIIEAYSGNIRAESNGKGTGTAFYIHIPQS